MDEALGISGLTFVEALLFHMTDEIHGDGERRRCKGERRKGTKGRKEEAGVVERRKKIRMNLSY